MNRFIGIVCMGFLGLVLIATASQSGDKEKKTKFKGMLPNGWRALNLTTKQVQKIYEIQNSYKEKIAAIEEQILAAKGQERAEMFTVLNEEQKSLARKLFTGEDTKKKSAPEKKSSDEKK